MNGWARCCRSDTLEQMCRAFWRMLRGILRQPFKRRPRAVPKFRNSTRVFGEGNGASRYFPRRPRYSDFPRVSKLARRVLQLLAAKTLVLTECPKAAPA